MNSLRLFWRSFRYNFDAHISNPVNFYAGVIGMIVNNLFFLYGMWLMLFAGKPQNQVLFPHYLTLMTLACIAWGTIQFCFGGLAQLGSQIENGSLEPMLGTPRSPLFLSAISYSNPPSFGDIVQGLFTWGILFWLCGLDYGLRVGAVLLFVWFAFLGLFILAGSISFFIERGSNFGFFIVESTLSMSMYPAAKMFEGNSRYILYLTPAFLTGILPIEAIEQASIQTFATLILGSILWLFFAIAVFKRGLRKFRAATSLALAR